MKFVVLLLCLLLQYTSYCFSQTVVQDGTWNMNLKIHSKDCAPEPFQVDCSASVSVLENQSKVHIFFSSCSNRATLQDPSPNFAQWNYWQGKTLQLSVDSSKISSRKITVAQLISSSQNYPLFSSQHSETLRLDYETPEQTLQLQFSLPLTDQNCAISVEGQAMGRLNFTTGFLVLVAFIASYYVFLFLIHPRSSILVRGYNSKDSLWDIKQRS